MILLRNVLDTIDTGEPFHVTVVTCDLERNTGGKLVKFGPAVLNQSWRKKGKSSKPIQKHNSQNN
jgi:hypothetical protein